MPFTASAELPIRSLAEIKGSFNQAIEADVFENYVPVKTIEEALERLESFLPRVASWTGIHQISSGGLITSPRQEPPLLCSTRELAVETWFQAVKRMLINTQAKTWFTPRKPIIELWQTTITTPRGDHRTAAERYSAVAHIGVTW